MKRLATKQMMTTTTLLFLAVCLLWRSTRVARPSVLASVLVYDEDESAATTTIPTSPAPAPLLNTTRVLFLVMGQARYFETWLHTLQTLTNVRVTTTLLYGSYDCEVVNVTCSDACHTRFIPNTTWTQGRNELAAQALLLEHYAHQRFDYWIFLDDDVEMHCDYENCWNVFLEHLLELPPHVTTLTATHRWPASEQWTTTAKPDAMLAAMPRYAVEYMLPYVSIKQGRSQWLSQGVWSCIMQMCFTPVLFAPSLFLTNGDHRPYTRENFHVVLIFQTALEYQAYLPELAPQCLRKTYGQYSDLEVYDNQTLPKKTCQGPLVRRFHDWQRDIFQKAGIQ